MASKGFWDYLSKPEELIVILILTAIICSALNWNIIGPMITPQPKHYPIELCNYSGQINIDQTFISAEKRNVLVPDYNALIYIEPISEEVNLDSPIEFSYKVIDKEY